MSSNDNALSAGWRTASYSNGQGSCVEAGTVPGAVLVRDTTLNGRGPVLRVTPAGWGRFVASIKD
ncbi:MAG TPA: DUF397 domain-containing protein [Streptosporangiaceae bacterium]|nr:DUF397 domain-containing protein [Streptosporangiaceae bacterium]